MIGQKFGFSLRPAARYSPAPRFRILAGIACSAVLVACGGGGGGGGGAAAPANAPGSPAPTLTLTSSAASVTSGGSVELDWQSSNADSCRASGGWDGDKPVSGSESLGPLLETGTYSLSCSGAGGAALREVTVTVNQEGGVDLAFNTDQLEVGVNDQVELSWTATNADTCEASGAWEGPRELSGTFTTPPLTEDATFKLTCFAQADTAESVITVRVLDTFVRWQAPTENIDGTPFNDLAGFVVYWGNSSRNYGSSIRLGAADREWEVPFGSGTYYLAVTAINGGEEESGYSNEIRKIIP